VQATDTCLREQALVLAVQDTVYLDWTHHPATKGLGPLAQDYRQGLLSHNTVAITPERVPLGIMQQQVWARDAATFGQPGDRKQRPIHEKERQKWLDSLAAVIAARERCPDTQFVSVGDSEADVYDLFATPRPDGVDLLIRAGQNCPPGWLFGSDTRWRPRRHGDLEGLAAARRVRAYVPHSAPTRLILICG
jgi:hypothetical protein